MIFDHNQELIGENTPPEVIIWDETMRDGEQAPGVVFSLQQKMELARLMDEAGVGIIDLGFPVVSVEEQETVRAIAGLGLKAETGVTLRAKKEDIDCALKLGIRRGFVFTPTSYLHIKVKFGIDPREHQKAVLETIKYAVDSGMDLCFISEDTTRSDPDYVIPMFNQVVELGVDKLMITDTVGVMVPATMRRFVANIIGRCPRGIRFGIHCHNDFGLATANTLAAVEAGVIMPTVTINGIGERAGNASFEETVMALELIYKIKTGIDLKKIMELSQRVEFFSGLPVPPNKAVVGYNAFRHESGIHVHAMLKELKTYETFPPELLGRQHEFVLGKHSGRSLLRTIREKHRGAENPGNDRWEETLLANLKKNGNNRERKEAFYHSHRDYYRHVLGVTEQDVLRLYDQLHEEFEGPF